MLKLLCLPLKDVAEELGVSYSTARNWSSGRIKIPEEHRQQLAEFMRQHAERIREAAAELESDDGPDPKR